MTDPAILERVRALSDEELAEAIRVVDRMYFAEARPEQLTPPGDWRTWYVRGGRGSGKTRTGGEQFCEWLVTGPPGEWAIIAPTFGDGRDTCVEGPSGALVILRRRGLKPMWNRSMGELRLANGSRVYVDGADDGALRIQGKNLRGAWCDEVGLWRRWQLAWDESLAFALRLAPARVVATGTPKMGHGLVKRLLEDDTVVVTLLRTLDNAENLDPGAVQALIDRYQGTTLGRQELDGEFVEDVEGALWTAGLIESAGRWSTHPPLREVVVAVDPPASETGAECGIVVVGSGFDPGEPDRRRRHAWVLDDRSIQGSPETWARAVVGAFRDHEADRIVAEVNQGGDMVAAVIRNVDPNITVEQVRATRGKQVRAQPVAGLYEQARVHHPVDPLPDLESQLCSWVPGDESPDRLDALVWGVWALMDDMNRGQVRTARPQGRLPSTPRVRRSARTPARRR